ncbi:MAG TPA: hypothetical protein VFC63_25260 [Blastocatellia bacterium]|nr:hypothetical protein [Blastocatellia bacterium]
MSDAVFAAIIGVGGSVLVAATGLITQLYITRTVIRAEREKLREQLRAEELSRTREKRKDRLLDAVSELLTASDPQTATGVNYGLVANLIIHVQLLLDLNIPTDRQLNAALNNLGLRLQEYVPVQGQSIDDKSIETTNLLEAHNNVIQSAKAVLAAIQPLAYENAALTANSSRDALRR